MKLKDGIIVRELDGEFVAVDAGIGEDRFNGMLKLNKTAAFVLECLRTDTDENGIVSRLTEKYDVYEATAAENVSKVVETLKKTGLITE